MINFYTYSFDMLICLVMLSSFCLLVQVFATAASFNRHKKSLAAWSEGASQVIMCVNLFIQAMLISQVMNNLKELTVADTGFTTFRYIIGIAIIISVIVTIVLEKEILPTVALPALVFTLPWAEKALGIHYDIVYILALIFWLVRAIFIYVKHRRARKNQISAFSIKQAIDRKSVV